MIFDPNEETIFGPKFFLECRILLKKFFINTPLFILFHNIKNLRFQIPLELLNNYNFKF